MTENDTIIDYTKIGCETRYASGNSFILVHIHIRRNTCICTLHANASAVASHLMDVRCFSVHWLRPFPFLPSFSIHDSPSQPRLAAGASSASRYRRLQEDTTGRVCLYMYIYLDIYRYLYMRDLLACAERSAYACCRIHIHVLVRNSLRHAEAGAAVLPFRQRCRAQPPIFTRLRPGGAVTLSLRRPLPFPFQARGVIRAKKQERC